MEEAGTTYRDITLSDTLLRVVFTESRGEYWEVILSTRLKVPALRV
jgi:hypothetical protein